VEARNDQSAGERFDCQDVRAIGSTAAVHSTLLPLVRLERNLNSTKQMPFDEISIAVREMTEVSSIQMEVICTRESRICTKLQLMQELGLLSNNSL
jgi:hypothetical protein